jgi:hypothetical protein
MNTRDASAGALVAWTVRLLILLVLGMGLWLQWHSLQLALETRETVRQLRQAIEQPARRPWGPPPVGGFMTPDVSR